MSAQWSSFLGLPPEVRGLIYLEVLATHNNSVFVQEFERAADHTVSVSNLGLNLLRTCKTIYSEGRGYSRYEKLIFATEVKHSGLEAMERLPKLGQQLSGSLFKDVSTLAVGVTDIWRVISSLGSLQTRMTKLKLIQAINVKRMPYRYWTEKFPSIVSSLESSRSDVQRLSRACRSDSDRAGYSELEIARFRCHIRFHYLINEDEHYIDDDEDGYNQDRGAEVFPMPARAFLDRGLELHICGRWLLVDRKANNAVQRLVETTFNLLTGRILDVRPGCQSTQSDQGGIRHSTEALLDIERQAVRDLHMSRR